MSSHRDSIACYATSSDLGVLVVNRTGFGPGLSRRSTCRCWTGSIPDPARPPGSPPGGSSSTQQLLDTKPLGNRYRYSMYRYRYSLYQYRYRFLLDTAIRYQASLKQGTGILLISVPGFNSGTNVAIIHVGTYCANSKKNKNKKTPT